MEKKYNVINGTAYDSRTAQPVINALEQAYKDKIRIKLYFGDIATGRCWNEEHDIIGYLGRSTGTFKIPILLHNKKSYGGGAILDYCIIKIREAKGNRVLYQATNFQQPKIEIKPCNNLDGYTHEILIDGELYSRHKSERSAILLKNKLS